MLGNTPAVNNKYYTFDVKKKKKKLAVLSQVNQFMLDPRGGMKSPDDQPNQPNH